MRPETRPFNAFEIFDHTRWSTVARTTLPRPVESKAFAMPGDNRLRFHNARADLQSAQTRESHTQKSRSAIDSRTRCFWLLRWRTKS